MKSYTYKSAQLLFFAFILILSSCKDDDDSSVGPTTVITPNEEELITTVNIILTDSAGTVDTVSFNDPDGDGGNAPTIDTLRLRPNAKYSVQLTFLDESDPNDVEDITAEIMEENDEHLVCFTSTNVTGLSIQRTDTDGTFEVGLASNWETTTVASSVNGSVRITLKHQPDVKNGDCNVGDTDVEIDFPTVIK